VSVTPSNGPRIVLAAIAGALAAAAAPRVTLGASGWMRSLPIDARSSRRAAIAAISVAQLIVPIALLIGCIMAVFAYRAPLSLSRVLAVFPMLVAVGGVVLPRQSIGSRALYTAAVAAAVVGTWPALTVSLALLGASERIARDVGPRLPRARGAPAPNFGSRRTRSAVLMWARSSWRAIGARHVSDALLVSALPLAFAYLVARNNADLARETVGRVVRVCGAIAIVTVVAGLSNALLRRRRPWPWARSLPWSASRRVAVDALVLGVPTSVAPLVLGPLSWTDSLVLLGLIPFVAIIGAAAVRSGAPKTFGAAGRCVALATPVVVAVVVWPAVAVVTLAGIPAAVRWAARLEMNTAAMAWIELQHDAAGDPYWLSRP
jgi:hypothetical protein